MHSKNHNVSRCNTSTLTLFTINEITNTKKRTARFIVSFPNLNLGCRRIVNINTDRTMELATIIKEISKFLKFSGRYTIVGHKSIKETYPLPSWQNSGKKDINEKITADGIENFNIHPKNAIAAKIIG